MPVCFGSSAVLKRRSDSKSHLPRLGGHVEAGHQRPTLRRRDERAQHQHSRRFPRTVRPQETVDLSSWGPKVNAVHRPDGLVATHQSLGENGVIGGGSAW